MTTPSNGSRPWGWLLGTAATALAAEALDADLRGQLVASGCWEPSER